MTDKTLDATLAERGNRYGDFATHAAITYSLKRVMYASPNFRRMPDDMKEALDMIAHKLGRILNGDPFYDDSWRDLAGYARLVEQRLVAAQNGAPQGGDVPSQASGAPCVKPSLSEIAKRFVQTSPASS